MTSQTYPSGRVIGYEYDDKGELVSISIDGVPFIKNIKTNDNGLLSYEYNDGSKHTREYDTNGRVTKLSYPNYTEEVNYNVVSNITKIKADTISRTFGYDNLDRLTSYEQNATDFQKFVYDANGNRLNQNQENNLTKLFSYRPNSNILNSIKESNTTDTTNISYEYDKTGNIIKDDKHTYTYDSRNRLVAVDSNVTYQYNYDNKRVSKTVNGVKTYFIYDGHKLIGEYQINLFDNSREEYVYLNSTPIAVITPKGTYRLYADHLDTPRRVATNDEDATVLWKWESKPFGESMADEDVDKNGERFVQNLRFPGQYFDTELKTHYNINRDYNPVTGRYVQSDPVGFDGGVNGYVYVGGKPIILIDLEGQDIAVITGDRKSGSINVFGHSAMAITHWGVYSWQTGHIWGASIYDYLWGASTSSKNGQWIDGQVDHRNVVIHIIKTKRSQDSEAVKEYFKIVNKGYSKVKGNTCATAVSAGLKNGAGLSSGSISRFPASVERYANRYSQIDITLPEGSDFSYSIYNTYLRQFENYY